MIFLTTKPIIKLNRLVMKGIRNRIRKQIKMPTYIITLYSVLV